MGPSDGRDHPFRWVAWETVCPVGFVVARSGVETELTETDSAVCDGHHGLGEKMQRQASQQGQGQWIHSTN